MPDQPVPSSPPAADAEVIAPSDVKVVPKPWGEERWFAHTDRYAGKLLIIKKGERLSLQYHERKHEVQYVDSGRIKYTLGSADRPDDLREMIVEPGSVVVLPPGAVHRMEALEDSRIFEMSTPELDDVVRIEDDYGRAGDSAP
jgi:mannose-6-phosphate isomerase-like protein (cupin superfamily)